MESETARVEAANHRSFTGKLRRTAAINFLLIHEALQLRHKFVGLKGRREKFQHTLRVIQVYRFPGIVFIVKAVLTMTVGVRRSTAVWKLSRFGSSNLGRIFAEGVRTVNSIVAAIRRFAL